MSGFIFYRGPSLLDGAPIVAIATLESSNTANGAMVQTWILRSDVNPIEATHTGQDGSVCGAGDQRCKHAGQYDKAAGKWTQERTCYVMLLSFNSVYAAFKSGVYADLSDDLDAATDRVTDRLVRLGAYGDPAAVPASVWRALLRRAAGHTGYTHQWRSCDPTLAALCMASTDTEAEVSEANALGFRSFRVAPAVGWNKLPYESLCPKSDEAGKKTTCDKCLACGGTGARARCNIMIPLHNTSARAQKRRAVSIVG